MPPDHKSKQAVVRATSAWWVKRGHPVLALSPGSAKPSSGSRGLTDAVHKPLLETVTYGVRHDSLIVVDVDGPEELLHALPYVLPPTLTVQTRRGTHRYYQDRSGPGARRHIDRWPGVDVLAGEGSYSVGPGSWRRADDKHPVDVVYASIVKTEITEAPPWLRAVAREAKRTKERTYLPILSTVASAVPDGPLKPAMSSATPSTYPARIAGDLGDLFDLDVQIDGLQWHEMAWGDWILQRCACKLVSAPRGTGHDAAYSCAYTVGGVVAGGWLDEDVATEVLADALARRGGPEDHSRAVRDGLADGAARPIVPPWVRS